MKYDVMLEILFELLNKRKLTAPYLADKYGMSVRSVYRYIDTMSISVPITVKSGRNGGIFISDTYKLPIGFLTHEEYRAADEALAAMYSQLPEERFLSARQKLGAQDKKQENQLFFSGDINYILIDNNSWGESTNFSDKIRLFENAARAQMTLEITYFSAKGNRSVRKIDPYILVYKQNVWYIYAYCHERKDFRLFRIGRVYSAYVTDDTFTRRQIKRSDIPLRFWETGASEEMILEVSECAFADVQDWLGCESMSDTPFPHNATAAISVAEKEEAKNDDKKILYARAVLPIDTILAKKILSLGAGVKVLSPVSLQNMVATLAGQIAANYKE